MSEILITGGAGNLGRELAGALWQREHWLRVLDLPTCDFSFSDGWERVRVFKGDILDPAFLEEALDGVEWVFHLAAILPPASEIDRERTFRVNVDGTRTLVNACGRASRPPRLVLASSVSVYGDTSGREDLVGPEDPVAPTDWYAESKIAAERIVMDSSLPYVNLRISAISIPAFLDPPEPWPFMRGQRIELVALADLVSALVHLVGTEAALGKTLVIAGGPTWRVTGEEYVRRWGEIMDIPFEEMAFQERPGWLSWYDTSESQALLDYQKTPLEKFFRQLEDAVAEALA